MPCLYSFGSTNVPWTSHFTLKTIIRTIVPGSLRTWGSFHEAPLGCLGDGDGWHILQQGWGLWGDTTEKNDQIVASQHSILQYQITLLLALTTNALLHNITIANGTVNTLKRSEFKTCLHSRYPAILVSQKMAWPPQTTKTALPWTPGSYSVEIFKQE